jgi:hypothetical protein
MGLLHDCLLRGKLTLRGGDISAAVASAFRTFLTSDEQQSQRFYWPHQGVSVSSDFRSVEVDLSVRGSTGYRVESIEALVRELDQLVKPYGHLELVDNDTTSEDKVQPYWVGPNERAKALARASYGLELARPYITSATGEQYFDKLIEGVLASVNAGLSVKRPDKPGT